MTEADTAAACESNSHHISDDEVAKAQELASKGEQRLRVIVEGEPNVFSFYVPCEDGRRASVELHVFPVHCDSAQHTFYAVSGNYSSCHDTSQSDQVLTTAQLVYDTYIRVTPLTLRNLLEQHPPNPGHRGISTPPGGQNAPGISARRGGGTQSFAANIHFTSSTAGRKRLRDSNDSDAGTEPGTPAETETETDNTSSHPETESRTERLDKLVKNFIQAVTAGQARRKRREKKVVEVVGVDDAVSQCLLVQANDECLDKALDQLEAALDTSISDTKTVRRKAWETWFYLANLRIVRELRRNGRKHRPSIAAKLVNRIVNHLLVSDGHAAWGVYDGLAERCYKASRAADLTPQDVESVSVKVATGLHNHVTSPNSSHIPFPGVWLSVLLPSIPFETICCDIGLPNLSALGLHPEWFTVGERHVMAMGVQASLMKDGWTAFVKAHPTLQAISDEHKSDPPAMMAMQEVERVVSCSEDPRNLPSGLTKDSSEVSLQDPAQVISGGSMSLSGEIADIGSPTAATDWSNTQFPQVSISRLDHVLQSFDTTGDYLLGFDPIETI